MSERLIVEQRWLCNECRAICGDGEYLKAKNPFNKHEDITGCPECFAVDTLVGVCDAPTCKAEATCGWSDKAGTYRRTCGQHMKYESDV